jgi:hypothetical protein
MTTQQPPRPQSDWTRTKMYAVIIAATAIVVAGAAFYQAWRLVPPPLPPHGGPVVQHSPTPAVTPSAAPTPSPTQVARRPNVCGVWLSETSQKKYDFVCQGEDFFEIYEVGEAGANKTGTGKITGEGSVEADLLSLPKKRRAQLKLTLSADGRKLEGSWQGEDPRESGRLMFHKV